MRIVADENIPCVDDAFGAWGDIRKLPGAAITAETVREADVLLVRSVTRVNAALLKGSRVRHVATATSGTDHIDTHYLGSEGIAFCDAPGSNADGVAQYVVTALSALEERLPAPLPALSIGIVGVGEVGARLARLCGAFGMRVVLNDPPRVALRGDALFRPLEETLDCDVVSLHVPLVDAGPHPTRALANASFFQRLRRGAAFINASRGDVVDESALTHWLDTQDSGACVLDVWRNEPRIDIELLGRVDIGTPHIAGYSVEGKLRGTQMIHDRLAAMLGRESNWDYRAHMPAVPSPIRAASPLNLRELFSAVYDIRADDAALRAVMLSDNGTGFHRLRKNHPPRREFSAFRVDAAACTEPERQLLTALGFVLGAPEAA